MSEQERRDTMLEALRLAQALEEELRRKGEPEPDIQYDALLLADHVVALEARVAALEARLDRMRFMGRVSFR